MTDDFADAPLVWRVAMKRLLVRHAAEQRKRVGLLALEGRADVSVWHLVDVREVVLGGFGLVWAHGRHHKTKKGGDLRSPP